MNSALRFVAVSMFGVSMLHCGKPARPSPTVVVAGPAPSSIEEPATILSFVPGDTPFFIGNLNRSAVNMLTLTLDKGLSKLSPLVDQKLASLREQADLTDDDRVTLAMLSEIEGRLTAEGLLQLGIDVHMPYVLFGLGLYPVFRLELADGNKLIAALERIRKTSKKPVMSTIEEGASVWQFPFDDDDDNDNDNDNDKSKDLDRTLAHSGLLIIDTRSFTFAIVPTPLVEKAKDYLLGRVPWTQSLAASGRVSQIARRYNILSQMIGFFDVRRTVSAVFLDPSLFAEHSEPFVRIPWKTYDINKSCSSRVQQLTTKMPRIVWGIRTITAHTLTGLTAFEVEDSFIDRLHSIASPMPAIEEGSAPVALGFGMRVNGLIQLLERFGLALESLQSCDESLKGTILDYQKLKAAEPVFAPYLGSAFVLEEMRTDKASGKLTLRGLVGVRLNEVTSTYLIASNLLPNLPAPGGNNYPIPVTLPIPLQLNVGQLFIHLDATAAGISAGPTSGSDLRHFLSATADPSLLFYMRSDGRLLREFSNESKEIDDLVATDPTASEQTLAKVLEGIRRESWGVSEMWIRAKSGHIEMLSEVAF